VEAISAGRAEAERQLGCAWGKWLVPSDKRQRMPLGSDSCSDWVMDGAGFSELRVIVVSFLSKWGRHPGICIDDKTKELLEEDL